MNEAPSVSVLMSVYNGARYLREAVDSILTQTFTDFEFIIVDDSSTDETPAILDSYSDGRIVRLRNEANIGLTRSLNNGLSLARGTYVARQDADDLSASERLRHQVNELERRPSLAALFCAYNVIDETGETKSQGFPPTGHQAIREHLFYTCDLRHSNVMIRLSVLRNIGGYNEEYRVAQDYELWLRLSESHEIDCLPQTLSSVRVFSGSHATGVRRAEQRRMINRARAEAFARCQGAELSDRTIALHHFVVALHEISEGRLDEGAASFQLAREADSSLGDVTHQLTAMAVNLAVELGPSGRAFITSRADVEAADQFLRAVVARLPYQQSFERFQRDVFAEFHAACAYLYARRKNPAGAVRHMLQSWASGPLHRRNRGLIKTVLRSF